MWTQFLIWPCLLAANLGTVQTNDLWDMYSSLSELQAYNPCPGEPRCKCEEKTYINKKKTAVDCRNVSLTEVPTNFPNNTFILDLSLNYIKTINVNQFINYTSLTYLNISHNNLTELKPGVFEGLQNLLYLSLRNNTIRYNASSFQPGIFKPLVKLIYLNIQQKFTRNDYSGEDYTLEALKDLPELEYLSLDGIPEKNLDKDIFQHLRSLKVVNFTTSWGPSRCLLPKLTPKFFPPNTTISNISLSNCDIKRIEANTFKPLTNLLSLDVSHNEELTFDCMLNISKGLESTQISTLKLNKVHGTLGSCVTITERKPKGVTKNLNLKEFYLESNRIATLERKAVKFIPTSLETISIRDNIILLDNYMADFFQHNFSSLRKFVISDQNRNHYLRNFEEESTGRLKRNRVLGVNHVKLATAVNDQPFITDKHSIKGNLRQNKTNSADGSDYLNPLTKKIQDNINKHAKTSHAFKRHLGEDKDMKLETGKSSSTDQIQDEKAVEALVERTIAGWMRGFPIPLPRNLRSLDASNMKVRLALYAKTLAQPNNLRTLSLNRNVYYAWYGPFRGFENLTRLDLSWNSCNSLNLTIFQDMPNLVALNLSLNYLDISLNKDEDGTLFRNQGKLEILSISNNKLRTLPSNIFSGLKSLKFLFLGHNLLKTFEVDLSHMNNLQKLNIWDNQLETISKSVREVLDHQAVTRNITVSMHGNNFKCDCANLDFVKWMSETHVRFVDLEKYVCQLKNREQVSLNNAKHIYESLVKECFNYMPIIVISTAALVLVFSLSATVLIYRFRWNLRYMYYMAKYKAKLPKSRKGGYQAIGTEESQYKDVNVSYADEESGFIRQKIYTELEVNRGLQLHIRDRDSPIAEINDIIIDAIERSKKTLIIMSKSYLKHKWCIFEMRFAGIKAQKTGTNLLCVLMLEEVPKRKLPVTIMRIIKDQQQIEYPGDDHLQDCFWDRLKDALTD